jgi:hypothetical protein
MEDEAMNPDEARATLDEVALLRRRIRRERQALWFPAIVFALITLASAPLYRYPSPQDSLAGGDGPTFGALGGLLSPHATGAGLYWLIAIPLGYLLTAAYFVWRARRRGVVVSWRTWALTGFALFAFVVFLLQENWGFLPGDLVVRGLLPLIVMAVGFAVLAGTQRSLEFGVFAAGFFAVALTANLYDLANLVERMGVHLNGALYVNNLVAGAVLLAAGGYFALRARGLKAS